MTAPSQQAESGSTVSALVARNLGHAKIPNFMTEDETHNKFISIAAMRTSKYMCDRQIERTMDVSCYLK
jgi:hypothetical protein